MNIDVAENDNAWPDDSFIHAMLDNGKGGKTACSRPLRISEYTFPSLFVAIAKYESTADVTVLRTYPRMAGRLCRRCLSTFEWESERITVNEQKRLENLAEMAEMLAKRYALRQVDAQDYGYVAMWSARAREFRDKANRCRHNVGIVLENGD